MRVRVNSWSNGEVEREGRMEGKLRVGFVGIGNMGWPMAGNVIKGGYEVTVFDMDTARARLFAAEHSCAHVETLSGLAQRSDVVITMLPRGSDVRHDYLEAEGGALSNMLPKGAVAIDMSSSDPVGTRELAAALAGKGIALIDAPVSGGIPGAKAAKLAIMVGKDDEAAYGRIQPLLRTMGDRLFEVGGVGAGHAIKALNNYCSAAAFTATAEAVLVGEKFGLDPKVIVEVINASSGRSASSERAIKDEVVTERYAAGFAMALMTKDVNIAAGLARALHVEAPMLRLTGELWTRTDETMGPGTDFTASVKVWRKRKG